MCQPTLLHQTLHAVEVVESQAHQLQEVVLNYYFLNSLDFLYIIKKGLIRQNSLLSFLIS